jgi:signal transduction histidine kinase
MPRLQPLSLLRVASAVALGCLCAAGWMAYDLQTVVPVKDLAGIGKLMQQDQFVARIRKAASNSGTALRDFLLDRRDSASKRYSTIVVKGHIEANSALEEMESKASPALNAGELRRLIDEYWIALDIVSDMQPAERRDRGIEVQKDFTNHQRSALTKQLSVLEDSSAAAQNEIKSAYADSRLRSTRQVILLIAVSIFLGLLLAVLHLGYTRSLEEENNRKLQALIVAKTEMEQLSARLFNIQEEERRRLSRELHDGIGQTLTALRIEISHFHVPGEVAPPETRERWLRARSLAEDAVRTIRNISLLLRPSLLDDLGLEPALRWLSEEFYRRTGIVCEFSTEGLDEQFADAWKTCVYRVVQEALHNCEKHASPSLVRISLQQRAGLLGLSVEDDGVGFEVSLNGSPLRHAGLGILGMRERAAMLGGKLSIVSSPGHGTQVAMTLPLVRFAAQQRQIPLVEKQLSAADEVKTS